jgi:hypothetical protein
MHGFAFGIFLVSAITLLALNLFNASQTSSSASLPLHQMAVKAIAKEDLVQMRSGAVSFMVLRVL